MKYQFDNISKLGKKDKKTPIPTTDTIAPSPSEKVAREELLKLIQNSEDIRKIKKQLEKELTSKASKKK